MNGMPDARSYRHAQPFCRRATTSWLSSCWHMAPTQPTPSMAPQPCTSRDIPTALALLGAGIDVNKACSFDGAAPLHHASQLGHLELVQLLISRGADIDMPGPKGRLRIVLFSLLGRNVCQLLFMRLFLSRTKHSPPLSPSGCTPLLLAALHSLPLPFPSPPTSGCTPLLLAAEHGHRELVRLFISHGAAVNCAAADGFTPLRMTTQNGHRDIIMLLRAAGAVA